MPSLAELHAAVQSAVAAGRIGHPVFVRYHLNGLVERESKAILPGLACAAAMIGDAIGEQPNRLYSLFSHAEVGQGQETIVLQFPSGATAIVSEVHGQGQGDGTELMVLGTRGAAYHSYDGGTAHVWEAIEPSLHQRRTAEILMAIEHTRERGVNPVAVAPSAVQSSPAEIAPARRPAVYGVLLVSGGQTHQEWYAPAFAADPRCRLVAVTDEPDVEDRRRALNERFADSLGLPYIADLDTALAREDVQVVSVCAEPERRARIIVRCAEAGKHLYLDKPLAPTHDEAIAVVAAVRRAGVRSHMFTFVTTPWARRAKRLLQAGLCGRLLAVHADTFFAKGHAGSAVPRLRREQYPPGRHQLMETKRELDNIGVYPITLVHWLTGQGFHSVYGITGNYFFAEHQRHDVEDFGLLAGRLEDGTTITIACGRCGWASHPAGGANRIILVGSERTLVIDANRPRLEISATEPPWAPPPAHPDDPMAFWQSTQQEVGARPKQTWVPVGSTGPSDASLFLDALDAGRDGEVNAAEAARATEILLAGYRSAATGQVVLV